MNTARRLLASASFAGLAITSVLSGSDPLTKRLEIDFGRDVSSRNLAGLATCSDGSVVAGPALTELAGPAVGELLWTFEPVDGSGQRWLVGTGPEGRIVEVTLNGTGYTTHEIARVAEPQVFALKSLPGGALLAGTSPTGALYLIRNGKVETRVVLPVDSIFDVLLLPEIPAGASPDANGRVPAHPGARVALVATGNPGHIYRIDLDKFGAGGVNAAKVSDPAVLAAKGITLFGEIHDRNVRRLALLPGGRIAAGSAPHGNVYLFPGDGGHPVMLQENREAEVTDLLPQPNGDLYAAIVFSPASGENRINHQASPAHGVAPPAAAATVAGQGDNTPAAAPLVETSHPDRFAGRTSVVFFPANGFPELVLSRNSLAFYRLARRNDLLLIAAGDQGELMAWDIDKRLALTFPGSVGSQLNGLAAVPGSADRFLLLRNNAPGLALLEFDGSGPRHVETDRLDLGVPAELGSLRFSRLGGVAPDAVQVDVKTSLAADETEGWTDWARLAPRDGAYYGAGQRGRYVKLRVTVPAEPRNLEIDAATLYNLPQNRRAVLTDFRVLPPNLLLNPPPEFSAPLVTTLGQLINPNQPSALPEGIQDNRRKLGFFGSQLVPDPGNQAVFWTVSDPDGDTLAYTFSIKPVDAAVWTDLAVDIRENYVQFDTSHLADGIYASRLIVSEQAPRPAAQRLRTEFATDDLVVDHTPPEILDATARREGDSVIVTVHGRDALSLLDGAEFVFNNGHREVVSHPVDGINDGREETYELPCPSAKIDGATAVEIRLSDEMGNVAVRRLSLPAPQRTDANVPPKSQN
jgi:hypothetical protein